MVNKEIYTSALRLIAESDKLASTSDYEERFPYILALFFNESEELDRRYRIAHKLPVLPQKAYIAADVEEEFPLSEYFISAAVYYVAAMLIIDENIEFSDKLFEKYTARMGEICASLPCEKRNTKNIYN